MIRFGRYHLMVALGLVLAYNSILGMFDSLKPDFSAPLESGESIAPVAAQFSDVVDADLQEINPPPELITLSSQPDSPREADPTSPSPTRSAAAPLPVPATPAASTSDVFPEIPLDAALPPLTLAEEPIRLVIPAIGLDAPIVPAKMRTIKFRGEKYQQWLAPNYHAAGWHTDSARLGTIGNTVLSGHHNVLGAVFKHLVDLQAGDTIQVYSRDHLFVYQITNRMIVPEKYQQMDTRMANLQWILPSQDERLTLITCWPDESNTHRVIIVAAPIERLDISAAPQ